MRTCIQPITLRSQNVSTRREDQRHDDRDDLDDRPDQRPGAAEQAGAEAVDRVEAHDGVASRTPIARRRLDEFDPTRRHRPERRPSADGRQRRGPRWRQRRVDARRQDDRALALATRTCVAVGEAELRAARSAGRARRPASAVCCSAGARRPGVGE